jgi:hypothetical protein
MKFKVLKGTKLFDILDKIGDDCMVATREARKIVEELGFEKWRQQTFCLAGGISAFHAPKGKPDGYVYAYSNRDRTAVLPKKIKSNKELLERIEKLPEVKYEALNKPLNYDGFKSDKFNERGAKYISMAPGIVWRKNYILLDMHDYIDYKPVKDMIEITTSEYKKLYNNKKQKSCQQQKS